MGKLSTHVLDIMQGIPAPGVRLELYHHHNNQRHLLIAATTNADGRTDAPLLTAEELRLGHFELCFYVGDYFQAQGITLPEPAFLDMVPIHFHIADSAANYHVPLLVSPWSYSTYRGS